ncbi:MAG: hypothetical protein KAH32_08945 [Chlamydiia bacterium]|nr:hypothetical protein [Chlamydiia bacterium]
MSDTKTKSLVLQKIVYSDGEYKKVSRTIKGCPEEIDISQTIFKSDEITSLRAQSLLVSFEKGKITYRHDEGIKYSVSGYASDFIDVLNDMKNIHTKRVASKYLLRLMQKEKKIIEMRYANVTGDIYPSYIEEYASLSVFIDELEKYLS